MNQEIVAIRDHRPETGLEHPVGIGRERGAVTRIVVAGLGMLMDVRGLYHIAIGGVEAIAGEIAGVSFSPPRAVKGMVISGLFFRRATTRSQFSRN